MRSLKFVAEPRGSRRGRGLTVRALQAPLVSRGFAPSIRGIVCQLASRILALVPQPAPTQAREVVSDLSAVQTPPQLPRIRRVALPPLPFGPGRPRSCP